MKHLEASYGITLQDTCNDNVSEHVQNIIRIGFSCLENVFSDTEIDDITRAFDDTFCQYQNKYGSEFLKSIDEHNGVRMPFILNKTFLKIPFNETLLSIIRNLMGNNFILNQQNAIINPAKAEYNQDKWHRDLCYTHNTFSKPLMINALYCVDDFTLTNGSTFVLPGSHNFNNFPSENFVENNQLRVKAKRGSLIILDSMLFHKGSRNFSDSPRRAINNVFASPHIKQQIDINSDNTSHLDLDENEKKLLGVHYKTFSNVETYLNSRKSS